MGILTSMDPISHPLDWWAYGGYTAVIRETGWSKEKARREVHKAIKSHGWNPIGHKEYEQLRQRIMNSQTMNWDLT